MHALSALGDLYQNLALGAPKACVSPPKYKKIMIKNLYQLINRGCQGCFGRKIYLWVGAKSAQISQI